MDVKKLSFSESVTITDSAGNVLATSVPCNVFQHEDGMRDKVADINVRFKALSVVTAEWTGVPGSVRVFWRGNVVYWAYALQHYNNGDHSSLFCSPIGSPSLDPPTGSSVSGSIPHKRHTSIITQSGTSAPTAALIENSVGQSLTWVRTGLGTYEGQFSPGLETVVPARVVPILQQPDSTKILSISFTYNVTLSGTFLGVSLECVDLDGNPVDIQNTFSLQLLVYQ